MKRLWVAAALCVVLAALVSSGMFFIKKYTAKVSETLNSAAEYAEQGDNAYAAALCKRAEDEWKAAENVLKLFVNTSELSEIGVTVTRLKPLIENDDSAAFMSELNAARVQLIHISNMESVSLS